MTENPIAQNTVTEPPVETEFARKKRLRNIEMWKEYERLMEERMDRSRTLLKDYLKEKYDIHSDSGYYSALEQGRKSAGAEAASQP